MAEKKAPAAAKKPVPKAEAKAPAKAEAAPEATVKAAAPADPAPSAKAAPAAPAAQPTGDHKVLAKEFKDEVTGFAMLANGQGITEVAPDGLFAVATGVKAMGYRILSVLSAYNTKTEGSGVFYAFVKPANTKAEFADIRLRVKLAFDAPEAPGPQVQSLCDVFPSANWHEREMHDMYGIRFEGHPDLRRMFLPEGWKGYPMRLDYAEPEQFVALREGEDVVVPTEEEGSW